MRLRWFGACSLALAVYCILAFWLSSAYARRAPRETEEHENETGGKAGQGPDEAVERYRRSFDDMAPSGLVARSGAAALVTLLAGFTLSQSANAVAKATGLGAGLVGLGWGLNQVHSAATATRAAM